MLFDMLLAGGTLQSVQLGRLMSAGNLWSYVAHDAVLSVVLFIGGAFTFQQHETRAINAI